MAVLNFLGTASFYISLWKCININFKGLNYGQTKLPFASNETDRNTY